MLILINNAYERAASLIINADGRWQYDDPNQTDVPIATTSLFSSQQDYTLATAHLRITRVEIKDSNSTWNRLQPIDQNDESGSLSAESTVTGFPLYYDLVGASIFLYPVPNYSQSASLKVYFERSPIVFTSSQLTTGTAVPGFNSLYHDLIPLIVAADYWMANDPSFAVSFFNRIQIRERDLVADYARRDKDDLPSITIKPILFR